jgi:hypothetical protein
MRKHNSESLGSLLAMSLRRSRSGLSAWSRESISGVSGSLSNRMCTKNNDRDWSERSVAACTHYYLLNNLFRDPCGGLADILVLSLLMDLSRCLHYCRAVFEGFVRSR